MLGVKYLIPVLLVFVAKICAAYSERCTTITGYSGIIKDEKTASTYSKCWYFKVSKSMRITMEDFSLYSRDCDETRVEISLDGKDETYDFCPRKTKSIILKENFYVRFYITTPLRFITSRFSLKYEPENPECNEDEFECNNGNCLHQSQVCDGNLDCIDGADEAECDNRTVNIPDLTEYRMKGLQWLKNRWSHTTGWQENTHRGITVWFLAKDKKNEAKENLEEKLMVKQLEVQTLVVISRKETDGIPVNQLSMFVNALILSCQNPYNFHGHDLVKLLKDEVEVSLAITHGVAYLALCNAGATLPINATKDLGDLLKTNVAYSFLLEIQAVTVMALSCLKASDKESSKASFPHTDYEESVEKFKKLQMEDGSFGNIYTTAIVTQALVSAGQEGNKDWSYSKAINHLIHHLKSPCSDFLAVYLIIPILNGKCLSDIANTNCSTALQHNVNDVKSKLGPKIRIQYTLNIGDEKDIVHTISLRVPENITVFEMMQLAQDADSKYKFKAKQMDEKLYIYSLAGLINDFENGKFWLLYVGKDIKSVRHTKESPDKIALQDGLHIVMWYKNPRI